MTLISTLLTIRNWRQLALKARYQAAKLAQACQVSARTLRRFFQERLLTPLRVWLERARINDSKANLLLFGMQVKQVASEAGYARTEHFCRRFKTLCGVSPAVWAASHRAQA